MDKGEARFFFLALKAVLTNNPNPEEGGVWSSNDLAQRIMDAVKTKAMEGGEFKAIGCAP